MTVTPEALTPDMVRAAREAKQISREDFEAWTYDDDAARRVCSAINCYRRSIWLSSIDG